MPAKLARNQTSPEWIPTDNKEAALGTGLFLVIDPHAAGPLFLKSVAFHNITYAKCVELGELGAAAFKWFPSAVVNSDEYKYPNCGGDCEGLTYCPGQPHCFCIDDTCQRFTP